MHITSSAFTNITEIVLLRGINFKQTLNGSKENGRKKGDLAGHSIGLLRPINLSLNNHCRSRSSILLKIGSDQI